MTAIPPKVTALVPPLGSDAVWAAGWTPAEARLAVDQYRRGTFRWGWQLSIDAPGYPPIKSAIEQRLATPCGLPWGVEGGERAPARLEVEASRAIFHEHLARLVRSSLRDLAMCGLFVWHHPLVTDPETLRTTVAPYTAAAPAGVFETPGPAWGVPVGGVQRWPLSAVGWTAYPIRGVVGYYAIAQGNLWIQLPRPGTTEGEWTVGGEGDMPHLDGAICSLDMEFTAGMLARRARSNLGVSAGKASPYGTMPQDVPVHTTDGNGNPVQGPGEDAAETLAAMGSEQMGALFPHGFVLDKFELTTTGAAEYFTTDLKDSLLMVSLAVMGHGGSLAKTDAQYRSEKGREVDVPEALTRRDVRALERAANGLFAMLAEENSGLPAERAPKLNGRLPDADQADRMKSEQERRENYLDELVKEKELGIPLTQEHADSLAWRYEVEPVVVPATPSNVARLDLAPTDLAKVVRVDEARASRDLPPIGDERGEKTIGELDAAAKVAAKTVGTQVADETPTPIQEPAPSAPPAPA
jgi:hypothetical protein